MYFIAFQASDFEIVWVLRGAMLFVGAATTVLAITVKSIVALIVLSVDLPYCIIFPQLVAVIFLPASNAYGSMAGLIVAVFLRVTCGEPFMGFAPLIKYPWYDEASGMQRFPIKTFITAASFLAIIAFSRLTRLLHRQLECFRRIDQYLFQSFVPDNTTKITYHKKETHVLKHNVITKDHIEMTDGEQTKML